MKFADEFSVYKCAADLLRNPLRDNVWIAVVGIPAMVAAFVRHPVRVVQHLVQK